MSIKANGPKHMLYNDFQERISGAWDSIPYLEENGGIEVQVNHLGNMLQVATIDVDRDRRIVSIRTRGTPRVDEITALNSKTVDELYETAEQGLAHHYDNAHDNSDAFERGRSQGQKDAWRTVILLIGVRKPVEGIHSKGCPLCGKNSQ